MKSMRRYGDDVTVKARLDRLQAEHSCCGDSRYTDWFRVSWVPDEYVDVADPAVRDRVRPSSGGYRSDDVPFSCCDRAVRRPCVRQFIHDNTKHFNYDYQVGVGGGRSRNWRYAVIHPLSSNPNPNLDPTNLQTGDIISTGDVAGWKKYFIPLLV